MSEEETYNQIQNYLSGTLSKSDQLAFEQSLAKDPELAKQFKLYKLADELVIERRLLEVNNILLDERKKGGNSNTRIILSAAVLLLGSAVAFSFWGNKKTVTSTAIVKTSTTEQVAQNTIQDKNDRTNLNGSNKSSSDLKQTPFVKTSSNTILEIPIEEKTTNALIPLNAKQEEPISEILPNTSVVPEISKPLETGCENIHIDVTVSSNASCKGESNGSVSFTNIKGGTAPYTISLKTKQRTELSSLHVPAGNYSAVLYDKKGCIKTIENIIVSEKICEKEYSFNPFMDEVLNLPQQDQYAVLSIYERSGALYFSKELEPNSEVQWNGYSKNGELNPGYFIFVISDQDGKISKGGITIVR